MTLAQQIIQNAISIICNADFNGRFPFSRKDITVAGLEEMAKQCEGGE